MSHQISRRIASLLLAVGACAVGLPAHAQVIEAGVNATPSVLILFDTSGSMEWLDEEDTYPRCLTTADEYLTYAVACTNDADCQSGLYCNEGRGICEFERSRYHEALEALTGTIVNYFPACDNRDSDSNRIDQATTSPPQGIRHSIACSYQSGLSLAQMCYRTVSGTLTNAQGRAIPPAQFRQRNDGLLDLYGSLLNFGFMSFDSFRDPTASTAGMFSYGVQGYSPAPGVNPASCANDGACWNLGSRRPGDNVEGGAISPIDPSDDTAFRRQQINELVQLSALNVVPYWSTPIGSMLEDALTFYTGGDETYYSWYRAEDPTNTDDGAFDYARGLTDLYGECRRRSVILITDGVPSFDECTRRGTTTSNDPFQAGCDGYWYKDSEYYARALLAEGIETYVIGFSIIEEFADADPQSARSRLQRIADEGSLEANPVRYADSSRELIFELGDILSQLASASTGRARPATYSVLTPNEQGLYSLNARFNIDRASRYWSGDLRQNAALCSGASLVPRTNVISAAAELDDRSPSDRTIFTARPEINSCALEAGGTSASLFNSASLAGVTNPLAGMTNEELADACDIENTGPITPRTSACASLLNGEDGYISNFSEIEDPTGTCLVAVDPDLAEGVADYFRAQDEGEARFFLRWLRGETLTEIREGAVDPDGTNYEEVLDNFLPANLKFDPVSGRYLRDRLSSLADIFHSSPVVLGPPIAGPNSSGGYRDFAVATEEADGDPRRSMVFVGTNDGLLHAFDARTLEEIWAFLPPSFGPRIGEWIEPGHTFMFDGTPVVQDIVVDRRIDNTGTLEAQWASILVAGYRGGGRGYVAMDVTDPAAPRFLWELDSAHDPQMGLTYAEPGIGVVRLNAGACPDGAGLACERGVAILTGGLPPLGASETSVIGRVVYVIDLATGRVLRRFTEAQGTDGTPAAFASALGGSVSVYNGADGSLVSRAFFGDAAGRLYRLDVSSLDPTEWRVDLFFDPAAHPDFDATLRYGQVVFRPTISLGEDRRAVVVYGTGNVDQLDDVGPDQNFAISLTERPIFARGEVTRYEGFVNWAVLFEQYEKMTARPRIFNDRAYFATFVPSQDNLCDIGGARLYGLTYDGDRQRVTAANDYGEEGPVGGIADMPETFFFLPESSNVGTDGSLSEEGAVGYWDEDSGSFIPPKTILYSLDFSQAPVCVPIDPDDPAFSQTNIVAPNSTGSSQDIQLVVNMSSFETDAAGTPAANALTRTFDLPINEQSRAYATSWTIVLE